MTEQQRTAEQRIGDAERERTAALLGEHVGAGRLELAEFEERVRSAYAARTAVISTPSSPTCRACAAGRPRAARVARRTRIAGFGSRWP